MSNEVKSSLSDFLPQPEVERFALAGIALSHVQSVEAVLHHVLTFALNNDPYGLAILTASTAVDRRKPLGHFLTQLRKRTGLRADLEEKLGSFLERRNTLAHHLEEVPGWKEKTPEAYAASNRFLYQLTTDSHELQMIFVALSRAWQKEVMPDAVLPEQDAIDEMTKHYQPILNELFFKKD